MKYQGSVRRICLINNMNTEWAMTFYIPAVHKRFSSIQTKLWCLMTSRNQDDTNWKLRNSGNVNMLSHWNSSELILLLQMILPDNLRQSIIPWRKNSLMCWMCSVKSSVILNISGVVSWLNLFEMTLSDTSTITTNISNVSFVYCFCLLSDSISLIPFIIYYLFHVTHVSLSYISYTFSDTCSLYRELKFCTEPLITKFHHCARFQVIFRHNNLSASFLRVVMCCHNPTSVTC
jgi:hypothetical protein